MIPHTDTATLIPPAHLFLVSGNLLYVCITPSFQERYTTNPVVRNLLGLAFFSLGTILLRFIHVVGCPPSLLLWSVPRHRGATACGTIRPRKDMRVVRSYELSCVKLLWTLVSRSSGFVWDRSVERQFAYQTADGFKCTKQLHGFLLFLLLL